MQMSSGFKAKLLTTTFVVRGMLLADDSIAEDLQMLVDCFASVASKFSQKINISFKKQSVGTRLLKPFLHRLNQLK